MLCCSLSSEGVLGSSLKLEMDGSGLVTISWTFEPGPVDSMHLTLTHPGANPPQELFNLQLDVSQNQNPECIGVTPLVRSVGSKKSRSATVLLWGEGVEALAGSRGGAPQIFLFIAFPVLNQKARIFVTKKIRTESQDLHRQQTWLACVARPT